MRALRGTGVQQLHQNDRAGQEDDDVQGLFREEVIFSCGSSGPDCTRGPGNNRVNVFQKFGRSVSLKGACYFPTGISHSPTSNSRKTSPEHPSSIPTPTTNTRKLPFFEPNTSICVLQFEFFIGIQENQRSKQADRKIYSSIFREFRSFPGFPKNGLAKFVHFSL